MLPDNLAHILNFLKPTGVVGTDYILVKSGGVLFINKWNFEKLGAIPSEEEITAAAASQEFADWMLEHGGDKDKTKKRKLREKLDEDSVDIRLLKTIIRSLLKEINDQKQAFNDLLQWLGSQNNLNQRSQLTGFTQIKNNRDDIINEIKNTER